MSYISITIKLKHIIPYNSNNVCKFHHMNKSEWKTPKESQTQSN